MITCVTGIRSKAKPRDPVVVYGINTPDGIPLEQICTACNGTGESKTSVGWVCGVCFGCGCEMNNNGKAILMLLNSHTRAEQGSGVITKR